MLFSPNILFTTSFLNERPMRYLIYDTNLGGHHIEYLHHYYIAALSKPEDEFIFCIDKASFENRKGQYNWPETKHIRFEYISQNTITRCNTGNIYIQGWRKSKEISLAAKKYKCDKVILTMLMEVIPFILFMLPKNTVVRGIIYMIYLYELKQMSLLKRVITTLRYLLMVKSNRLDRAFILNDKNSAIRLNKIYHTNKFHYIPDPVPSVEISKLINLRSQLSIPKDSVIYLHFGVLSTRKGTLDILEAIKISQKKDLLNKHFVFAGVVKEHLRIHFYQLIKEIKELGANILVFDEFCSKDFLYNLCYTCDIILMPYHYTNLSSGVLGYAAVFKKPVIGPGSGIIGNCIREYRLGHTLSKISKEDIKEAFLLPLSYTGRNHYEKQNSIDGFIKTILE